ncbi:MAG: galactose oxidase [Armatimonadetes bacterium]|nr:galactose oxidase [Armatimonadota bacterium]
MDDMEPLPDWTCVTEQAAWQARDSMGDLVFRDHLWILGGWFGAELENPRDVWKSPDGRRWTCVQAQAPWGHSDLPAVFAFGDRMWLMAGRKLPEHTYSNLVWSSEDGAAWTCEGQAGWCPRVAPAFAVFRGRMWILGGTRDFYRHDDRMVLNDVWASADGRHWELVTERAGWSKRGHHQALVFDGKLWVLTGGRWAPQHEATNDVWCSEDGRDWTQVTAAAPWGPRLWAATAVCRGRMWLMGGWSKEHGNYGDVWCSEDGEHWTEMSASVIWRPRHEHSAFVFQDRLWVAGGYAESLSSEVWSLALPRGGCPSG